MTGHALLAICSVLIRADMPMFTRLLQPLSHEYRDHVHARY